MIAVTTMWPEHWNIDGQLAQYLAGVPDLLSRLHGPGDPYGQAVIFAALDAARLGCQNPLPVMFLTQAAVGYLTSQERTLDADVWAGPALRWATEKLKGAVRAVQPVPFPHGTGIIGYRPADYLEQHGQRTRQYQMGPAELWDALTEHIVSATDLARLAESAASCGLRRHAATALTLAAARGDTDAAAILISLLQEGAPEDIPRAARWAAIHASLDNPKDIARLLTVLLEIDATDSAVTLANRAAEHATLDNPYRPTASLLTAMRKAAASDAAAALANRAANARMPITSLGGPYLTSGHWKGREPDGSPSEWSWQEPAG